MKFIAAALVVLALVAPWACQASSAGETQSVVALSLDGDCQEPRITRLRAVDGYQADSSVTQALDRKAEVYLYALSNGE